MCGPPNRTQAREPQLVGSAALPPPGPGAPRSHISPQGRANEAPLSSVPLPRPAPGKEGGPEGRSCPADAPDTVREGHLEVGRGRKTGRDGRWMEDRREERPDVGRDPEKAA